MNLLIPRTADFSRLVPDYVVAIDEVALRQDLHAGESFMRGLEARIDDGDAHITPVVIERVRLRHAHFLQRTEVGSVEGAILLGEWASGRVGEWAIGSGRVDGAYTLCVLDVGDLGCACGRDVGAHGVQPGAGVADAAATCFDGALNFAR